MKEATGDLNMTVVIAMIVAALASFFYFIIWPKIGDSQSTDCAKAVCGKNVDENGMVECTLEGKTEPILCKYKG